MNSISIRKRIVDTDVVNDITCSAKVLLHVWSYDFYDTTLSTEKQRRHVINITINVTSKWHILEITTENQKI